MGIDTDREAPEITVPLVGLVRPAEGRFGASTFRPLTLLEGETTLGLLDRGDR